MLVSLAGAMSTAELGISLAEMIRQDKIAIISCTGANLEEDVMNLVAHSHYKRVPNYRDLTPQDEWDLLENHYNRVTDTCIPEEEAFRRLQKHIVKFWKQAEAKGERYFPHEFMYQVILSVTGKSNAPDNGLRESRFQHLIQWVHRLLQLMNSHLTMFASIAQWMARSAKIHVQAT